LPLADIETIIVVILENRSFDHVLGYLSLPSADPPRPVDGLKDDPAWRDAHANFADGRLYKPERLPPDVQAIQDPPHDSDAVDRDINPSQPGSPKMTGFVEAYSWVNPSRPELVMGYYDDASVPVFDFFARHFAVCDRWFAALPTGTQPNRLMAMSGESSIRDNAPSIDKQDLVYDWLTRHKVRWCTYQSGSNFPFFSLMHDWLPEIVTSLTLSEFGQRGRFCRYDMFGQHWRQSNPMPSVVFIEPEYTDGPHQDANDDHPPTGVARGQQFLADIYATLISNPARWHKTMMIVTYDEHGGFFDHVPPLAIPAVAGGHPFTTTGVRVPALIVSPQVAPGSVFSEDLDHTSILQLLAARFAPGEAYSPAVAARQGLLGRLERALLPTLAPPAPPSTFDKEVLVALGAAAVAGGAGSASPLTATATINAQAFQIAAAKATQDHPDLVSTPGWASLDQYAGGRQDVG
jgi:phospholipase C